MGIKWSSDFHNTTTDLKIKLLSERGLFSETTLKVACTQKMKDLECNMNSLAASWKNIFFHYRSPPPPL